MKAHKGGRSRQKRAALKRNADEFGELLAKAGPLACSSMCRVMNVRQHCDKCLGAICSSMEQGWGARGQLNGRCFVPCCGLLSGRCIMCPG